MENDLRSTMRVPVSMIVPACRSILESIEKSRAESVAKIVADNKPHWRWSWRAMCFEPQIRTDAEALAFCEKWRRQDLSKARGDYWRQKANCKAILNMALSFPAIAAMTMTAQDFSQFGTAVPYDPDWAPARAVVPEPAQ